MKLNLKASPHTEKKIKNGQIPTKADSVRFLCFGCTPEMRKQEVKRAKRNAHFKLCLKKTEKRGQDVDTRAEKVSV